MFRDFKKLVNTEIYGENWKEVGVGGGIFILFLYGWSVLSCRETRRCEDKLSECELLGRGKGVEYFQLVNK